MGTMNPEAVMKNSKHLHPVPSAIQICGKLQETCTDIQPKIVIPVVMAGVIGIYGLIVAVLISSNIEKPTTFNKYGWDSAFRHLAAGLCVGFSGVGAGYAIGEVGDVGVRGVGREPRLFVSMILVMIFSEAIALFGLIVALVLST